MYKLLLISLAAATALGGTAHAQAYGPRPAYAATGWAEEDACRGGRFTLAGAHAGVTVLGVDIGASAGLHVGLHDRCGGGARPVVYPPSPAEYGPSPAYGPPEGYAPPPGYGDVGYPAYAPPAYAQPAYSQPVYDVGTGYEYAGQPAYGYRPPCGC